MKRPIEVFVSVHKRAKKELGQYPAFLTEHLVNNPYLLLLQARNRPAGITGRIVSQSERVLLTTNNTSHNN